MRAWPDAHTILSDADTRDSLMRTMVWLCLALFASVSAARSAMQNVRASTYCYPYALTVITNHKKRCRPVQ